MGAMENKSLNVFNTSLTLAREDTATDDDYERIEGVIGHEYFHNWTFEGLLKLFVATISYPRKTGIIERLDPTRAVKWTWHGVRTTAYGQLTPSL